MAEQSIQVCGRRFTHEALERIEALVARDPLLTRAALSRKDIYLDPLEKNFRELLCHQPERRS